MDDVERQIEAAQTRLAAGKRALLRPDGSRVYSDAEHAEREQALARAFRQELATVQQAAGERLAEAERALQQPDPDPLYSLTPAELERANQLRPFIDADAGGLGLRALVTKVEAALASDDRAAVFCWERSLQRRFDALPKTRYGLTQVPSDPGDRTAFETLSNLLDRLAERLVDPAKKARREREQQAAQEQQAAALGVIVRATGARYVAETYGRRPAVERSEER